MDLDNLRGQSDASLEWHKTPPVNDESFLGEALTGSDSFLQPSMSGLGISTPEDFSLANDVGNNPHTRPVEFSQMDNLTTHRMDQPLEDQNLLKNTKASKVDLRVHPEARGEISPLWGALVHDLGALLVVLNAARMLRHRPGDEQTPTERSGLREPAPA